MDRNVTTTAVCFDDIVFIYRGTALPENRVSNHNWAQVEPAKGERLGIVCVCVGFLW